MSFIHLNLHSEFSLADSLIRIKPLFAKLKEQNIAAIALTDKGNAFGAIKFYKEALKNGIKPIFGADCLLKINEETIGKITLLAQNNVGYLNLSTLLSNGYRFGQTRGIPHITLEWLHEFHDGLLIIATKESHLGHALIHKNRDDWRGIIADFAPFQDRLYLGLTRLNQEHDELFITQAIECAHQFNLPLVAVNNVRFLNESDFEAHEVRSCIQSAHVISDPNRPHLYTNQQYLKSPSQMETLFSDLPEAIQNASEIAKRCTVELTLGKAHLPDFPIPEGMTVDSYFRKLANDGLIARISEEHPQFTAYKERLNIELEVIISMGFPGYFLIVADFIAWSKANDIPVGPGRGSGAGSLVAWALKITDIDPIPYDLLFERFLNPERVSMPDFDIDFCMEGRDRVIEYVAEKYGRESVSQIATHGTMAAKAVVRDVGRALGHPYGFVDRIAKLIPFDLGITLEKALMQEPELHDLYHEDEEVKALIDYAKQLEGLTKSVGRHAGGVVISPSLITDFSPLYCEEGSESLVAQFDKDDVEAAGLVKFDFLGLRTLTIINWALQNIQKSHNKTIDILKIPLDDSKTFALLKNCLTTAVFQLESRGMKDLVKRLQPDTFEDIIALVALFRPGPLESGMVEDFINRKHGRANTNYSFPELEPILGPTYGVIVYQEQVMQISQIIGNYTLGGADLLRRAMGKKLPEEMAKQRLLFMKGAHTLGFDDQKAGSLFDLMEKFAGYGFNKSHSAAYALLSYQTAYLKANYPAEFMAAVLSSDMDNTEKVVTFIEECNDIGVAVVPPNINESQYKFTVNSQGQIVYGLGALKGVGESASQQAIDDVHANGVFKNLFDFCTRIDLSKLNRRVLEVLIKTGALDAFSEKPMNVQEKCQFRANLFASLAHAIHFAEQHHQNEAAGQEDLFGLFSNDGNSTQEAANQPLTIAAPWVERVLLEYEKETLGFYLTAHPIDHFRHELKAITTHSLAEIVTIPAPPYRVSKANEPPATIAGLILKIRTKFNQKGQKMTYVMLDDRVGRMEIRLFDEHLGQLPEPLMQDSIIVIKGSLSWDDFSEAMRVRPEFIQTIDMMRMQQAKHLLIENDQPITLDEINTLIKIMGEYRSEIGIPILFNYKNNYAKTKIVLGDTWKILPKEALLESIREKIMGITLKVNY